jgi:hypothetical protein
MKGFFGVFGTSDELVSGRKTIDAAGSIDTDRLTHWQSSCGIVTGFECTSVSIEISNDEWRGWFSGDLPGERDIPWGRIVNALTSNDYSFLKTLNGIFAILLVNKATGRVWAISDRRAQQPLFSYRAGDCFYVSTVASAFCWLPTPPTFNPGWLYETIYFNHPILETSFLEGVSRVPPATIMSWRPGDRKINCQLWASPFSRSENLLTGKDAARLELKTFYEVARGFFDDDERTAVALTAGFDSRAVLASAPRRSNLLAYTYGMAGCTDLKDAAAVAADLGIRHVSIELSDQFVRSVPELMVAAVRDSDGLERVLRAELLAVYPLIAEMGRQISIGGVSGDHLFRDHLYGTGNVPHIISAPMMAYIHGQGDDLTSDHFSKLFGENCESFRTHIGACLNCLQERHGDVRCPEGYQRYLVYESAPKHFGGEAALASNYVLFRSFYWDPRIVELSFTTERATLGLSERLPKKDYFLEATAQAGVIAAGKHYGGGKIHGVRASTWALDNRLSYLIEKLLVRGPSYIANGFRQPRSAEFLSWSAWLDGPANALCNELLGSDSRIRNYLNGNFLDTFHPSMDLRLASRLLTAELVVRLVEQRWPLTFQIDAESQRANSS